MGPRRFRRVRHQRCNDPPSGRPVPARRGRRLVPQARHSRGHLARHLVSDRPSRHSRRSRSLGIGLGDPARRQRMGRYRASGRSRNGCRAGLGPWPISHAQGDQIQPIPKRGHGDGRRHRSQSPWEISRRPAASGRRGADLRTAGPRQSSMPPGGPRHRLGDGRYANGIAQDPKCRWHTGDPRQHRRKGCLPVRRRRGEGPCRLAGTPDGPRRNRRRPGDGRRCRVVRPHETDGTETAEIAGNHGSGRTGC